MTDLSALHEAVVNCNASAAMKALPTLLDRVAELEEREKTLVVFANAALEHQREAEADLSALRRRFADMEARRNALFEEATALRQRHGEAAEKAWKAGYAAGWMSDDDTRFDGAKRDAAWLASSAKARLT